MLGVNQADDSGAIRLDDERALILELDLFPAIVDDQYIFGRVAATWRSASRFKINQL